MDYINPEIGVVRNRIFPSNTYFLIGKERSCVVIDPGLDLDLILKTLDSEKLKPVAILSTHGHFDHMGAVAAIKNKFDVPFYLHENDLKLLKSANFYLKVTKIGMSVKIPQPDLLIESDVFEFSVGGFDFVSYNFPGHTAGSCIFKHRNYLFSGDLLYKKGMGFNNFPGENRVLLKKSVLMIMETFDSLNIIFPGHGGAATLQEVLKDNLDLKNFLADDCD